MTVIEISDVVFEKLNDTLSAGIMINPTQIARAALLLWYKSKLSNDKIFTLIGQSISDEVLINSLEEIK